MPELPEVEALAAFVRERAKGHAVSRAEVASIAVLKTFDPPLSVLNGSAVQNASRRGKFLDLDCGDLHLVIHLARAGWLRWKDEQPDKPLKPGKSPLAFRLVLDNGQGFDLTEQGTQKRLAVYLVRDPNDVPGIATLGPEPMDLSVDDLAALLKDRRTQIKGVLRDQHIIAGIGNAYSDEVLHAAKMSPYKLAASFTPDEVATLHKAIRDTLTDAVDRSAGLAAAELKGEKKTGLRVHAKTGQPCPVCGDTIREVSFADSSLQYCPTCQTGGKPLADRRLSRLLKLQRRRLTRVARPLTRPGSPLSGLEAVEERLRLRPGELGAVTGVHDQGGDGDILGRVKGDEPAIGLFLMHDRGGPCLGVDIGTEPDTRGRSARDHGPHHLLELGVGAGRERVRGDLGGSVEQVRLLERPRVHGGRYRCHRYRGGDQRSLAEGLLGELGSGSAGGGVEVAGRLASDADVPLLVEAEVVLRGAGELSL
jgi:DNA-formamidopyrimidine glycosylase